MNKTLGWCVGAIVGLALSGRAGAQAIEVAPADQPPPEAPAAPAPEAPPEAAPAPPPPEAAPAAAETIAFGAKGQFVISLERAFGIDYISQTESSSGQDLQKTTATNLSLFGAPATGALSAFSFPRGAFDLFLAPDLSVGLGLGLIHGSTTVTPTGGSANSESFTGVLAMPRVGYAWHLAPEVALWPRAGISLVYLKATTNNAFAYGTQEMPAHYVAVTVEAPFVFTVLPRLAFTVGPALDVTFNGHRTGPFVEAGNSSFDERITEIGLQAGLLLNI
jgi:hypothetical protein